ncbi:hypothetical protein ACQRXC_28735 (plasmid) [Niallia taxi]|uniref:hypothetical protein n=1 Tax=Niallia TaxID=2837506 RepID=UPI0015F6A6F6|nr:hypothetical protein [Niallia taxi]MED4057156.1 hypothetical protein [Niallia taxi]MED4122156.1 hypothetical protein [Niallia taxi]
MNTKILVALVIMLVVSIFSNIALGFNVSSESKDNEKFEKVNKDLKSQVKELENGLDKAEGAITDDQLAGNEEAKKTVENFFNTQYNYSTGTYKEKFQKIKAYVNEDVYGQLMSAGVPDTPNIKFENNITNMKLYMAAKNKELTGLVVLDTVYTIDGVDSPETTQIYEVTVAEEDGRQKIISLDVLGTFASMSES